MQSEVIGIMIFIPCFSRPHCVLWVVVLVQEGHLVQWVPIIRTLIMQGLLVELLSKYSV